MKIKIFTITMICLLFLCGCTVKEAIPADTFEKNMQQSGFEVVDHTQESKLDYTTIVSSYVATKSDGAYALEYYIFDSEASAQAFYMEKREFVTGTGAYTNTELNSGNYSKFSANTKKIFCIISRVSNTVVYTYADKIYYEEAKKVYKDLGY